MVIIFYPNNDIMPVVRLVEDSGVRTLSLEALGQAFHQIGAYGREVVTESDDAVFVTCHGEDAARLEMGFSVEASNLASHIGRSVGYSGGRLRNAKALRSPPENGGVHMENAANLGSQVVDGGVGERFRGGEGAAMAPDAVGVDVVRLDYAEVTEGWIL